MVVFLWIFIINFLTMLLLLIYLLLLFINIKYFFSYCLRNWSFVMWTIISYSLCTVILGSLGCSWSVQLVIFVCFLRKIVEIIAIKRLAITMRFFVFRLEFCGCDMVLYLCILMFSLLAMMLFRERLVRIWYI